jgi:hypothetical protein
LYFFLIKKKRGLNKNDSQEHFRNCFADPEIFGKRVESGRVTQGSDDVISGS